MTESSGPYEVDALWEAPDGSQWRLVFWLKQIAGRPECVGLQVMSTAGLRLKAETLRALPFAQVLNLAWQSQHKRLERLADLGHRLGGSFGDLEDERAFMASGKPRQRARYTTRDLQRVAEEYREQVSNRSGAPTRDTAAALGLRYYQAAKLIERLRRDGLLPKIDPGVVRVEEEGE